MRSYVLHTTFLLTSWSAARQSALVVTEAHVIGGNRDRKSRSALGRRTTIIDASSLVHSLLKFVCFLMELPSTCR